MAAHSLTCIKACPESIQPPSNFLRRGLNEMALAFQHWPTVTARLPPKPYASEGERAEAVSSTQRIATVTQNEAGHSGRRPDASDPALRSGKFRKLEAKCFTHLAN